MSKLTNELQYFDALKRIASYTPPDRMKRDNERGTRKSRWHTKTSSSKPSERSKVSVVPPSGSNPKCTTE
jgi:hypothetical protein